MNDEGITLLREALSGLDEYWAPELCAKINAYLACDSCNDTGDLHRPDGEYVGACPHCTQPVAAQPVAVSAEIQQRIDAAHDHYMRGNIDATTRDHLIEKAKRAALAAERPAAQPVTDAMVERACAAMRDSHGYLCPATPSYMRDALTAALAGGE